MPIYYGTNEIEAIANGLEGIESIYYGDNLVWTSNALYLKSLGTVKEFDITTLGIDPSVLDASNFIALEQSTHIRGYSDVVYSSASTCYVRFSINKSYNSTTGKITMFYDCSAYTTAPDTALPIYLISGEKVEGAVKIKEKIDLGENNTFDVSSYDGYQNFTVDNFYFESGNSVERSVGPSISGAGPVEMYGWIEKSYDSSTGTLAFYNRGSGTSSKGNLHVWLLKE